MRMLIGNMKLVDIAEDRAVVSIHEEMRPLAERSERELSAVLEAAWGRPVRVEIAGAPARPEPEPAAQAESAPPPAAPAPAPKAAVAEHPLVRQAIELFGATLVGVQPRRNSGQG
jgi:pyruvate/2-oxoglutarate dehydrogenase complex dihydrolipoamide acyltransferase (E2) component